MDHLGFGCEVSQVVLSSKVFDKGGLCGDVGGQPHRLAYIGNAGQQQEVARRQGGEELQAHSTGIHQRCAEPEPLHSTTIQVCADVWSKHVLMIFAMTTT